MKTQEQINTMLDNLKTFREDAEFYKAEKAKILDAVKSGENFILADTKQSEAEMYAAGIEAEIRESALALYDEDSELPARVAVKQFTVVTVADELKAKEWCIAHFTPALKLDAKVFEKAAKDGNIPADLATVTKEARAQIATKL